MRAIVKNTFLANRNFSDIGVRQNKGHNETFVSLKMILCLDIFNSLKKDLLQQKKKEKEAKSLKP